MKPKPRRIQKLLNTTLLLNMLVLITLSAIGYTVMDYFRQKILINNELSRTCTAIAEEIDLQIQQLDTACLNTINSPVIKTDFANLANVFTALSGGDTSILQVNIYGLRSPGFGTGSYTGALTQTADSQDWYQAATKAAGYCYIPAPAPNEQIAATTGTAAESYYFSLVRMFYDDARQPLGYIEVLKSYDIMFQRARAAAAETGQDIIIYTLDGRVVYPAAATPEQQSYYYREHKTQNLDNKHLAYASSPYSDLLVAATIENHTYTSSLYRSLLITLGIFLLSTLICYLIAAVLARRLSAPLQSIYRQVAAQKPHEQLQPIVLPATRVVEIDTLTTTLNEAMYRRSEASASLLHSKEQELQARMLALQAQMNPHFLYNSLNTISAMAEEGQTAPIRRLCENITTILRYILADASTSSPLEEELENCELYLDCMKLRYGQDLTSAFNVSDELLALPVPKLCIQLLVENAAKFATTAAPPWHIQITGYVAGGSWYVEVQDTGPGFTPVILRDLRRQMDEILATGLLPSLRLNGMGLLNVFIRFYLYYGIPFQFELGNLDSGGAFVRVGGPYGEPKENHTL